MVEEQEEEQKIEVRRMTDEDIEKIPYHVVQSNSLVRANYGLEILEHKVINATISQIRKSDSKITAFFFTYKQLSSLCNIDMKNIRRQIQNVADGILDKKFTILGIEKKGIDKNENMENVILRGRWISLIKIYDEGITVQLSPSLLPYLVAIKRDFTDRKLIDIQKYKNEEAMRFDLLFTSLFNQKTAHMSVLQKQQYSFSVEYRPNDLRGMLGYMSKYGRTSDFIRLVIDPAIKELNEKNFFRVSYKKKRSGKNINAFEFTVSIGENNEWFSYSVVKKEKAAQKKRNTIEALLREKFGFSDEDIKVMQKVSSSRLLSLLTDIKNKKTDNPRKYLFDAAGGEPKSDAEALWDSLG